MYLHLTRFFVRPDDLLNTNYGRSGFEAERPILVPSKYLSWAVVYGVGLQGGRRRRGMTPALAPRIPVMTEDVGKSRP